MSLNRFPGGASNNMEFFAKNVTFALTISDERRWLLWTRKPQEVC